MNSSSLNDHQNTPSIERLKEITETVLISRIKSEIKKNSTEFKNTYLTQSKKE